MGVGAVVARAPTIARAARQLLGEAKARRARAALLVGYSEFNAWLGQRLRRLGLRVLWYSPPQIWAWRAARGPALGRAADRMAVILPFEKALWRGHGVDAHWVGHPALDRVPTRGDLVRERLGLAPWAEYVAVLPGSRPHEVKRHLGPMLDAVALLRAERGALDARVIVAPSLGSELVESMARQSLERGVSLLESSAKNVLEAFDVALAASGTVTLECVSAEVPPVIGYRTGPVSELIARRLLDVDCIGLPNLVLGERAFPELVQAAFTAENLADAAGRVLDDRAAFVRTCRDVKATLDPGTRAPSAERVARLIDPWLS
jgi:lipid-A-disaccharide synthase